MSGSVRKRRQPVDRPFVPNERALAMTPEAIRLYGEGLSLGQVSAAVGVPLSTIRSYMLRAGCVLRTEPEGIRRRFADRGGSPLKGRTRAPMPDEQRVQLSVIKLRIADETAVGTSLKPNGYIEYTRGPHKGRTVHAVLMEQHIGRPLMRSECVHHINENKTDNRIENLALMSRAEHTRLHRTGHKEAA